MTRTARSAGSLGLLLPALALAGCARTDPGQADGARQVLEGFSLRQNVGGDPQWTLKAEEAVLNETSQDAELTRPRMEFFQKGRAVSRVRSEAGAVSVDTHDVTLSTGVVLESLEDKSRLETEELRYSSKDDLFVTEAAVRVTRPGGRLRGRGLKAKPDLSEVRIFNQETVVQ